MASAILYCEVCHQNVALNDNFCCHCGMQLLCIMLEFLHRFHSVSMWLRTLKKSLRDVTRTLIGGGGGYSYIHVLPDGFLLNLTEAQKMKSIYFILK